MQRRLVLYAAIAFVLTGSLAACASILAQNSEIAADQNDDIETLPPSTPTADVIVRMDSQPAPAPARSVGILVTTEPQTPPTTPGLFDLRVWWPDEIYPQQPNSEAAQMLNTQLKDFTETYINYDLSMRRKRSNGLGGILPTLRTAEPVAPGAVADLTLMRRADMMTAAAEGLIEPLDEWIPPDIMDNLIPGTRSLGEINGVLYGVPYVLNIYHSVYRESVLDMPPLTFEDVIIDRPEYLLPAGTTQGTAVNWTILLQYRAAGGRLVDQDNVPVLDRDPLLAVLKYYEQGVRFGVFDTTLETYSQSSDYWNVFASGEANMADVDSMTYLSNRDTIQNASLAPIPTRDGTAITALDGWMWVLTTHDPDRQRQVRPFLSWMMRVSQQSMFTEALGILPSEQRALRLWDDQTYATFAQMLLADAQLIPNAQRSNSAAIALQNSLDQVLEGIPAEQAADEALSQFTG